MNKAVKTLCVACLCPLLSWAEYAEDFNAIADGADLKDGTVEQWLLLGNQQEAGLILVESSAGYGEGNGLVIKQTNVFAEHRASLPLWTMNEGEVQFSMNFLRTSPMILNVVLSSDAVAGFWVDIEKDSVQVSVGGQSPFTPETKSYPVRIAEDVWYTMEIRDIDLNDTPGASVAGKLYIFEADQPRNILLDGIKVEAAGIQDRGFFRINRITLRRFSGAPDSELKIDNIGLSKSK